MPLYVYCERHLWRRCFYYDNFTLKNSNEEEILGVTTDRKLLNKLKKCIIKQIKN